MKPLAQIIIEILEDLIRQAETRGETENAENFRVILNKLLNEETKE